MRALLSLSRMDSTCRSARDKSGLMNMFSLGRKFILAKMSYTSKFLLAKIGSHFPTRQRWAFSQLLCPEEVVPVPGRPAERHDVPRSHCPVETVALPQPQSQGQVNRGCPCHTVCMEDEKGHQHLCASSPTCVQFRSPTPAASPATVRADPQAL